MVLTFVHTLGEFGRILPFVFERPGQHLTFEFWPTWLGRIGPITFDLTRVM